MKNRTYNNFFMNFASRSKFNIIIALRDGPLSVMEIVEKVGEEQSAVSHNLIKLNACRILNVKQSGKQRIYSLNKETAIPMLRIVEKHVKKHCLRRGCDKDES
jgi:DNA-binding transcriptional ArsR family regulator